MSLNLPARPQLGWWAVLALCLIAGTVLFGDLDRFENPGGEKHVPLFSPGQNDFSYSYLATRALLAGVNPYHNANPEFTHPLFPPETYSGYKYMYPPGSLLLHAPFVLWKGADWQAAGRIWFRLSLVELALLAVFVWDFVRRIIAAPVTPVWIPFLYVCLTFNIGVELGLERGQGDIVVALLAWGAVACFIRGWCGASAFLSIWSTSIKGYAVLLAVGLVLLSFNRRQWRQSLIGVVLAIVLLVVPVGRYWGEAMGAVKFRSGVFWAVWYNHGFSSAVNYVAPAWREKGRLVLSLFAFAVSIASWIQSRRTLTRGAPGVGALWLATFATASLGTMVGYASLSVSYNLILVLPGVLILLACQERFRVGLNLPRALVHLLGASFLIMSLLLFSYRFGSKDPPTEASGVPTSAFGLVGVFLILAAVLLPALRRRAPASGQAGGEDDGQLAAKTTARDGG